MKRGELHNYYTVNSQNMKYVSYPYCIVALFVSTIYFLHIMKLFLPFVNRAAICMIATTLLTQAYAQVARRVAKCGSEINWNALQADPAKMQRYRQLEAIVRARMQQLARQNVDANTVHKIPVVFHIVDPNPNSITDADIERQLAELNLCFEGANSAANAPAFAGIRGATKLGFERAVRSPNGCDTNGITRTVSNLKVTYATARNIKYTTTGGIDAWDSYNTKYLNIWIGNFDPEPDGGTGTGIATFPDGSDPLAEQGVVIDKSTFTYTDGQFTEGRMLVHEVGHFFFLRHIWGDAAGCDTDDGINDTPLQDDNTLGGFTGLRFDSCSPNLPGINYQNHMDYTNDTCRTMFTKGQVLWMLASLDLLTRSMLIDPSNKALVAPEQNQYFNMCTTPTFTTNDFYAIGVGKGGYVWVGTSRQGIYRYNKSSWDKYGAYANNLVWDIKADQNGGVWIAQAGYTSGGTTAMTGGLNYFPDSSYTGAAYYAVVSDGLPSRYARGLFIDTGRYNGSTTNPVLWSAHMANNTAGVSSNGGIGRGLNAASPRFNTYRGGLQVSTTTQSVNAIGGNATEIWAIAPANYGKTQILRYNALTNNFIDTINSTTNPGVFPSADFDARAVYFDKNDRRWIGYFSTGSGWSVSENGVWSVVNSTVIPTVLPAMARVNANAITGDKLGNVYIGTDSGLVIYKGGSLLKDSSYKRYTKAHGLPDNNVRGICVDTLRKKILIATANGIVFWNPPCSATATNPLPYVTATNGDLSNPTTWCGGVVPPPGSNIIVRHALTINSSIGLQSIRLEPGGHFTVPTGVNVRVGQ